MKIKIFAFSLSLVLIAALCCACSGKDSDIRNRSATLSRPATSAESTVSEASATASAVEASADTTGASGSVKASSFFGTYAYEDSYSTTSKYKRTGEMAFSDSADNKYLARVAEQYGKEPSLLAAVYTVPDADGNLVFEFDGSVDGNGNLIRTADTLIAIYSLDKALSVKRASLDGSLCEYSESEAKLMFITAKMYVLPKFETELNG